MSHWIFKKKKNENMAEQFHVLSSISLFSKCNILCTCDWRYTCGKKITKPFTFASSCKTEANFVFHAIEKPCKLSLIGSENRLTGPTGSCVGMPSTFFSKTRYRSTQSRKYYNTFHIECIHVFSDALKHNYYFSILNNKNFDNKNSTSNKL